MPAQRDGSPRRGRAAWPRHVRWSVGAQRIVLVGLLVFAAQRAWVGAHRQGDFRLYTWTGEAALARGDLYHGCPWGACTWPPVFSLGCIPLALLERWSPTGARAVWIAVNGLALGWLLRMLARWAAESRAQAAWSWWPGRGRLSPASPSVLLPLLLCGRFFLVNLEFLQVNVLILFLEVAGLWWIAGRRELAGGSLIGLAAALKVLPALLIPWLFWRGRRRAAAAAAVAALAFTLAPGVFFGWEHLGALLADWPRAVRGDWGVNGPNQSILAMLDRVIGHGVTPFNAGAFSTEYVARSGHPLAGWLALGTAALAVAWAVHGWRRPLRLGSVAGMAEAGAVLGASVVLAPLAWVHYFVVLLVPATAVLAALRRDDLEPAIRRRVAAGLAIAAALIWLTSRAVVGPRLAKIGLTLSDITLAALLVTACSGSVVRRARG